MNGWIRLGLAALLAFALSGCAGVEQREDESSTEAGAGHDHGHGHGSDGAERAGDQDGGRPAHVDVDQKAAGEHGGDVVRIGLTDWTIETAGVVLGEGAVTLVVTNAGGTAHDLIINGELGTWGTPYLAPGQTHELQITARAGEVLELLCTVAGHEAAGMHTELHVAEEGEA